MIEVKFSLKDLPQGFLLDEVLQSTEITIKPAVYVSIDFISLAQNCGQISIPDVLWNTVRIFPCCFASAMHLSASALVFRKGFSTTTVKRNILRQSADICLTISRLPRRHHWLAPGQ